MDLEPYKEKSSCPCEGHDLEKTIRKNVSPLLHLQSISTQDQTVFKKQSGIDYAASPLIMCNVVGLL